MKSDRVGDDRVRADVEVLEGRSMLSATLRAHFLGSVHEWERDTLFRGEHSSQTYVDRVKPTLAVVNGELCNIQNRTYDDGSTSSDAFHLGDQGQYIVRHSYNGADDTTSRQNFTLRQIAAGPLLNKWYQSTEAVTEVRHVPTANIDITLSGLATLKWKLVGGQQQTVSVPAGVFQAKREIFESRFDASGTMTSLGTTYRIRIVSEGHAQVWINKEVGAVQRQIDETERVTINGKTIVNHKVLREKLDQYTPGV